MKKIERVLIECIYFYTFHLFSSAFTFYCDFVVIAGHGGYHTVVCTVLDANAVI